MKITFFSNFLNHHQLPFCLAMNELLEGNFVFVATAPVPGDRLKLGYLDMNSMYPFVLKTYTAEENERKAMELALESDIIIFGSAPVKYIIEREKQKKTSFIYTERPLKPYEGTSIIRTYLASLKHYMFRRKKHTFVLCASNYTAFDYSLLLSYYGKCFAWGYFPQNYTYDVSELMERKASFSKPVILWVARLLRLKHPEAAIGTAKHLKEKGIEFEMRLIGDGPIREEVKEMITANGLQDDVHLLGAMSIEEVRRNMEEASIFLFTSNYIEGWGAVMNESMNSGCAVVVSHAIGSAGFLVKNGMNGIIYPFNEQKEIDYWTETLLRDRAFREELGKNAYQTINDLWNAKQAAQRLVSVCENIMKDQKPSFFEEGPCSKAKKYSNSQYKRKIQKELNNMRDRKQS